MSSPKREASREIVSGKRRCRRLSSSSESSSSDGADSEPEEREVPELTDFIVIMYGSRGRHPDVFHVSMPGFACGPLTMDEEAGRLVYHCVHRDLGAYAYGSWEQRCVAATKRLKIGSAYTDSVFLWTD